MLIKNIINRLVQDSIILDAPDLCLPRLYPVILVNYPVALIWGTHEGTLGVLPKGNTWGK